MIAVTTALPTAYWLGLVVSIVLPVLVGLVTTRVTHNGVKAVLLLALSAINGFLVEYLETGSDPGYDLGTAVILSVVAYAVAVLTHFGLWKPTGVSSKAADSLRKAPAS